MLCTISDVEMHEIPANMLQCDVYMHYEISVRMGLGSSGSSGSSGSKYHKVVRYT